MAESIIYHYCSTEAFQKIIDTRSIFLSSIHMSNDILEGKLISIISDKLINEMDTSQNEEIYIRNTLNEIRETFHSLAICFSEKGDLLSQWRGYADDGFGFSIGFSKKELEKLARKQAEHETWVDLKKVIYNDKKHNEIIKDSLNNILLNIRKHPEFMKYYQPFHFSMRKQMEDDKNMNCINSHDKVTEEMLKIVDYMDTLKSSAFSEEKEWRFINSSRLIDGEVMFSSKRDKIKPYIVLEIDEYPNIISNIYIGPKNNTPIGAARIFVEGRGFRGVKFLISSASYR